MKKKAISLLLALVMLAAAAIIICREGLALKATDPLSRIYTREKAAQALTPVLPLFALSLIVTVVGVLAGIRDENTDHPALDSVRPLAVRKAMKTRGGIQVLRAALIILSLVLIVSGVINGSAADVFGKAIKICTECIGLG